MQSAKIGDTGYVVRSDGSIVNRKGKPVKPWLESNGYMKASVRGKKYYIHRLVAENFCEGRRDGLEVNHRDGNKLNNEASNLEWVTRRQNTAHAVESGLIKVGENHPYNGISRSNIYAICSHVQNGNDLSKIAALFDITEERAVSIYKTFLSMRSA